MEINYLGHSSFKLKGKKGSLLIDPFDPGMVGLKFPLIEADILCVSHQHDDHNYLKGVKQYQNVIDGPGEYEIKDISVLGFPTYHDDEKGEKRGKNTIYVFEIDGIRLAHLGDLGHKLSESQYSALGEIDILMIPVGGVYTIDAQTAAMVAETIEPNIILPMHYKVDGLNEQKFSNLLPLETFLKAMPLAVEKLPKLVIKKHEIGEDRKIIVLESRS